jgi:hypothetical protein
MVSGLGHLGWPALSKTDGERVLKIVRGRSESLRDAEILGEAAISVQWIKRKTAATQSPGQRREALILAAKKIEAAIKSIEDLPEATQREIDPEVLLFRRTIKMTRPDGGDGYYEHELQPGTLNQLHDRIDALAKKITVKRSGGKKTGPGGGRIEAAKKRAAADCALAMLITFSSKAPTLTDTGPYHKLTALLFKLATDGKVGDVEEVCRARQHAQGWAGLTIDMWEMLFEVDGVPKVFEDSD